MFWMFSPIYGKQSESILLMWVEVTRMNHYPENFDPIYDERIELTNNLNPTHFIDHTHNFVNKLCKECYLFTIEVEVL